MDKVILLETDECEYRDRDGVREVAWMGSRIRSKHDAALDLLDGAVTQLAQLTADLAAEREWAAGLERGVVTVGEIDGKPVEWHLDCDETGFISWDVCTVNTWEYVYAADGGWNWWTRVNAKKVAEGHKPTLREAMIAAVEAVKGA